MYHVARDLLSIFIVVLRLTFWYSLCIQLALYSMHSFLVLPLNPFA